ncbi:uncharacterized protein LOC119648507 [Hermetia illucens]|uniref:uncharacterized protein LOC119648507 n=1 Tax=Hermetia illucens TaxID=343691 RepID=UPI0018CC6DB1|nr:uncharacterized protein LOC119648507 [Hermetia illucens]
MAHVLRFVRNARTTNHKEREKSLLTASEMEEALRVIVKEAQWDVYRESMQQLTCNKQLNNSDPLSSLHPFLDEFGLLRVGGRLEASNLTYDIKHPIVLPYGHYVTRLILNDLHHKHLHAGPQALLAIARQRFWPIKGKAAIRSIVQSCMKCARAKPKLMTQLMGNLPAHRVQPARPFTNTGIDLAGPLWIHFKGRGNRPQKAYLAVFVAGTSDESNDRSLHQCAETFHWA